MKPRKGLGLARDPYPEDIAGGGGSSAPAGGNWRHPQDPMDSETGGKDYYRHPQDQMDAPDDDYEALSKRWQDDVAKDWEQNETDITADDGRTDAWADSWRKRAKQLGLDEQEVEQFLESFLTPEIGRGNY